jgi:AcrR family transcriptional regulator
MVKPPAPTLSEPRKPPRQRRAKATVDVILEAATRILEETGLVGFNTNAVAVRAGVSIGSLYQYFPSKESILTTLLRRERSVLLNTLLSLPPPPGLAELLHALAGVSVAHQLTRPRAATALEHAEVLLPLSAETHALNEAIYAHLAAQLGERGVPAPLQVARDIMALSRGMIDAAGMSGETDAGALTTRVWRAVFGYVSALGLTPPEPSGMTTP